MSRLGTDGRKILTNILFIFAFLAGLLIALYPAISSKWNEMRSARLISQYEDKVSDDSWQKEMEKMIAAAQAYNESLFVPAVPDAFSTRAGVRDEEYEGLLNLAGDGMMGYVDIPVIGVRIPVYHYTTDDVLLQGAGHLLGSALPVGGDRSHCVVSAHRGLPNAVMFTDLNLLKDGDRFYFHVLHDTFAYQVDQILEVLPTEVESLAAVKGEDLTTLVTCTPYGINTRRLLVRGHRIPFEENIYKEDQMTVERRNPHHILFQFLSILAGVAISAAFIRFRILINKGRKKPEDRRG